MTPEEKRAKGLYNKFEVKRTDGQSEPGQKHENCRYFVLDLDCDPYAIPAIQAYAEACDDEYPNLALDLQLNFGRQPPATQAASIGTGEGAEELAERLWSEPAGNTKSEAIAHIAALITADRARVAREARELSEDQRQGLRLALETIISEISERCYCVTGVEVNMWAFVTGERDREQGYGQGHVFDTEITAMHTLATLLGEWPCWEGDNMEWKPIELPTLALSQQTAKGGGENA
jgi:hypothetical protein